jgi:hypothetical protein
MGCRREETLACDVYLRMDRDLVTGYCAVSTPVFPEGPPTLPRTGFGSWERREGLGRRMTGGTAGGGPGEDAD